MMRRRDDRQKIIIKKKIKEINPSNFIWLDKGLKEFKILEVLSSILLGVL